ncbi:MAG: hypothetical protein LBV12_11935 [Puniceicoccales bacterium]|jgi:hypothetical protein|nr:hypothetical protein [Puniceicoccales bacterium]
MTDNSENLDKHTGPTESSPLPMIIKFSPQSGTDAEWNEALTRVEDYLRANRIHSRIHQNILILRILKKAAARHAESPKLNPTVIAVEEARELVDRRMAQLSGLFDIKPYRPDLAGRVAFMLADGPSRSPEYLLRDDDVPEQLSQSIRKHSLQASPDMAVSAMVPRPIDLGLIPDVAEFTWDLIDRRPLLRMFVLWAIFLLMMLGLFFIIRGRF